MAGGARPGTLTRTNPEPPKEAVIPAKIFVGNLDFHTTQSELTELFSSVGSVVDVFLPSDRMTGKPRGFAFVEFSSNDEAAEAIRRFNQHELNGRKLNVNPAEERARRPGGGGGGGGGGGPRGGFSHGRESFDFGPPPGGDRPFKNKGSRRGLRGKKRSLN